MITRFLVAVTALIGPAHLTAQASDTTVSSQKPIAVLERHRDGVTSLKFSPDGKILASASLDGHVILWQTATWTPARILDHGAEVYAVAFSHDGKMLASTGGDGKVVIWNPSTGQRLRAIRNNPRALTVTFAPNGELLIGGEDAIVRFVDPSTGKEKRTLKTENEIWALSVSGDGSTLATALPIRVWDYRTLSKKANVRSFGQLGLVLSRDGRQLASAESTGGALLWTLGDSATYVPLRTLVQKRGSGPKGYESFDVNMPVSSIDFSQNPDRVVGGSTNGLVYVWNHPDAQPPLPLKLAGHKMSITAIALSPNGQFIASGSLDRTIRIWKAP